MILVCPRGYSAQITSACREHCPIARRVRVPEQWHTINSATRETTRAAIASALPGADVPARTFWQYNRALQRGTLLQVLERKKHAGRGGGETIPLCALVAYESRQLHRKRGARARDEKTRGAARARIGNMLASGLVLTDKSARAQFIRERLAERSAARARGETYLTIETIARMAGISRARLYKKYRNSK